jgi:GNAT superfamily N-acetyltransferase
MPRLADRRRPVLSLAPASESDFEALQALRMAAMRDSIDHLGRFDPQRARERLSRGFSPAHTRQILCGSELVGFVVVIPRRADLLLDHLYIHPMSQSQGIGHWVMTQVLAEADAMGLPVVLSALRHSDTHRFYRHHGFVLDDEGEWDLHYRRAVPPAAGPRP